MTGEEARAWVSASFDAAAVRRVESLVDWIVAENMQQNLIAPASVPEIWARHVVDSLQLIALAPAEGAWLDIGTGGGFPGLMVAAVRPEPMTLVEPRRLRATFLRACSERLGLRYVVVEASKVERIAGEARIVSARAVASVENLLQAAAHCVTPGARWLLPRGSIDRSEIARVARQHGMVFHVEQSLTSSSSSIVILDRR